MDCFAGRKHNIRVLEDRLQLDERGDPALWVCLCTPTYVERCLNKKRPVWTLIEAFRIAGEYAMQYGVVFHPTVAELPERFEDYPGVPDELLT